MATAAKKTAKKSPAKKPAAKKPAAPKAPKEKKGPGVIGSIVEFLSAATKDKPLSKDALLDKLSKRFVDRDPGAMRKTINCQVPGRLSKEQEVKVQSNDEGYWIA